MSGYSDYEDFNRQDENRIRFEIIGNKQALAQVVKGVGTYFGAAVNKKDIEHFVRIIKNTSYSAYCGQPGKNAIDYTIRTIITRINETDNRRRNPIDVKRLMLGEIALDPEPQPIAPKRYELARQAAKITDMEPLEEKKNPDFDTPEGFRLRIWQNYENGVRDRMISQPLNEEPIIFKRPGKSQEVFLTPETLYSVTSAVNRKSLWRAQYAFVDSRFREITNDGTQFISFSIDLISSNDINTYGRIRINEGLKDVVQVEIPPLSIPYVATADNQLRKIYILIEEFRAQSIRGHAFDYHFECDVEVVGNRINLTPLLGGVNEFVFPITATDNITLRFYAPNPITFDLDRQNLTVAYVSPASFTSPTDHNLQTGDLVYFTNFTTLAPTVDQTVINEMNRVQGHTITKTSNTTFTIPVDLTVVTAPDVALTPLCIYGSKLIQFTMKFNTLVRTNLIGGIEDDI